MSSTGLSSNMQASAADRSPNMLPVLIGCAAAVGLVAAGVPVPAGLCLGIGISALLFVRGCSAFFVPSLVLTYPLEWSKTFFPFLLWEKTIDGVGVSIVELFRIVALLVMVVWAMQFALGSSKFRPRGTIALVLLTMIAFYALSTALLAGDQAKAVVGLAKLVFHACLFGAMVHFLNSEQRIASFGRMLVIAGFVQGVISVIQYVTGWYIWNAGLTDYEAARANATFADPNVLARFLVVTFVFAMCLRDRAQIGWIGRWLAAPVCVFALMVTFSRSGIVVLLLAVFMLWRYRVVGTNLSTRAAVLGWLGIAGLFVVANEAARIRLGQFGAGIAVLGARVALIQTAFQMFLDHPLWGVGIGSFRTAALGDYSALLPYGGTYVTESHTELITIAAEMGAIGLALAAWFFLGLRRLTRQVEKESLLRRYVVASWVSVIAIFWSAQSEGRLFDEPLLYMLAGVIVAGHRLQQRGQHSETMGR